jgi:uncharacterized membrane protein
MKIDKKFLVGIIILIILPFIVSFIFYPRLPDKVATHWNAAGEPDGYSSRLFGAFFLPILLIFIDALLIFIPMIDPLKENIMKFKDYYYSFIIVFTLFMFVVHLWTLLWNVGIQTSINFVIPVLMGCLFYYAGILLGKAQRNWFIGIRTPWTLSSDTVWNKTHKLGATLFKICGILSIIGAIITKYSTFFILIPLIAISTLLIVYSYLEYRKENKA